MTDYTSPVKTTFELQRKTIEQGQNAVAQAMDFQQRIGSAAVDSVDAQESAQRKLVELQQETLHSVLDAFEGAVPGAEDATTELRTTVDDQYETVLDNHAEVFENLHSELKDGLDSYDELNDEYLDAFDEFVASLVELHEDFEEQSVEAVEELEEQADELQAQLDDMANQMRDMTEQATDAVEA